MQIIIWLSQKLLTGLAETLNGAAWRRLAAASGSIVTCVSCSAPYGWIFTKCGVCPNNLVVSVRIKVCSFEK